MITDIFCKIIKGELPSKEVYRDEEVLVIEDINPQAPIHLLVIPIKHYGDLSDFSDEEASVLGKMLLVANKVAKDRGLGNGYRLVINDGEDGGKLVPHLHIHILGGKNLGPKIVR